MSLDKPKAMSEPIVSCETDEPRLPARCGLSLSKPGPRSANSERRTAHEGLLRQRQGRFIETCALYRPNRLSVPRRTRPPVSPRGCEMESDVEH
jgi:hypothetical protein